VADGPPDALAFRLLARLWLSEVRASDLASIRGVPELAAALPNALAASAGAIAASAGAIAIPAMAVPPEARPDPRDDRATSPDRVEASREPPGAPRDAIGAALTDLAVEYQRLFGFGLPPYESVFLDPSAMLMAPATARVEATYREVGWSPPRDARVGAADHLGAELLALADGLDAGEGTFAGRMCRDHLALWVPVLAEALPDLHPHPFYRALTDLTLARVLGSLPDAPWPAGTDPLPELPAPPEYTGSDGTGQAQHAMGAAEPRLPDVVRRLLTPREAGLYLTREAIAAAGRALELPAALGERRHALATLIQAAGQFDRLPDLFDRLIARWDAAAGAYGAWADAFPAWRVCAEAWRARLAGTRERLGAWRAESAAMARERRGA